jgi:hypothetical protein
MRSWVLWACLLGAAAASPALAADIDDGSAPPQGGYYDDQRNPPKVLPRRDDEDEDEGDDDIDDRRPPNRYTGVPPPPPYGKCVRSEQVREQLTEMGWRDFHAGQPVNGQVVTLRARRPNGRLFELTLDRCSGHIVQAQALEPRPLGPYAYKAPYERPYERPYYGRPYNYGNPWFDRPYAYRWPRRWFRERDDY